jgi:hypothetical protein
MKKLLLLLLLTAGIYGQDFIDTTTLVTGAGDTTYWKQLDGNYSHVYIIVDDTGSTYTDSIKAFSISKRLLSTDSVFAPIDLRGRLGTTAYSDGIASSNAGVVTKYLLLDTYIDRLYLTFANATFVDARRVKITIMGIKR